MTAIYEIKREKAFRQIDQNIIEEQTKRLFAKKDEIKEQLLKQLREVDFENDTLLEQLEPMTIGRYITIYVDYSVINKDMEIENVSVLNNNDDHLSTFALALSASLNKEVVYLSKEMTDSYNQAYDIQQDQRYY